MQAVFEIVGFFVCAAGAAFLLSMLIHRAPRRKQAHALEPGAIARIKTSNGVYRTRYSRTRPDGLAFAAPLQRDHYVPIAVGEFVTVEAPMANGVVIFRSRVVDRDKDTKEIMLAVPEKIHREDRRGFRRNNESGKRIAVEDRPAWLVDLSEEGIRFTRNGALNQGERIKLELDEEPSFGWVLECMPSFGEGEGSHVIRAVFEESSKPVLA